MRQIILYKSEISSLIDKSVDVLKMNEPKDGYFGCFSGGKDSIVLKALAELSGVNVEWHYHKTTIDPPELVRFIRNSHSDVIFDLPKYGNFFRRAEKVGFPTRKNRWCCREYKEGLAPNGAILLLGIRSEESSKRAERWSHVTVHHRTKAPAVLPILSWASDEIWDYIYSHGISYPSLYDDGFYRLGCIGCPMARKGRLMQFKRWPRYENLWKRTFSRIWDRRTGSTQRGGQSWFGDRYFKSWAEMWDWWLYDRPLPNPIKLASHLPS
jgi:phosphoadenosine phosphosulfate reductase